MPAC
jgi:hypothetical protein